jgi:hypothetical protein
VRFLLLEPAHDWVDQSVEARLLSCVDLLSDLGIVDGTAAAAMLAKIRQRASGQRLLRILHDIDLTALDYYRARSGRVCSIEGDDGEKCWIIPNDAMESVRHAIAQAEGAAT